MGKKTVQLIILFILTFSNLHTQQVEVQHNKIPIGFNYENRINLEPETVFENAILNFQSIKNNKEDFSIRLDSCITIDMYGAIDKYTFHYDQYEQITEFYIDEWNYSSWEKVWKVRNTYDAEGRILESIDATWEAFDWENFSKEIYQYNEEGLLDSFEVKSWSGEYWENFFREYYTYDSNGNLNLTIQEVFQDSIFINNYRISSYYNNDNLVDSTLYESWDGNKWENLLLVNFEYDDKERKETALLRTYGGGNWHNYIKAFLAYDSYDNLILISQFLMDGTQGTDFQRTSYHYNSNGYFDYGYNQYAQGDEWIYGDGLLYFTAPNGFSLGFNAAKLFAYYDNVTVVPKEDNNLVSGFNLHQNYPNPFSKGSGGNPSTNISFELPKSEIVSLVVFNSLGEKVITLIDAEQKAAGKHSISFNAVDLPSGFYIYRLNAGGYSAARKMLILK